MASEVYFAQRRATGAGGLMDKVVQLLDAAHVDQVVGTGDRVAVVVHFGERGNITHLRPEIARRVVRRLLELGARPFVTDTNARASHTRKEGLSHLLTAAAHGFVYATLGAPVVIADGMDGGASVSWPTEGRHLDAIQVAEAIAAADALVVLSHVTLHPAVGLSGALHRLATGTLSREGKLALAAVPALVGGDAPIEPAIEPLVEAACTVARARRGKVLFCNVILETTPDPDGVGWSDAPVVPDVGIMVGTDPVALDRATTDFLNMQPGMPGTRLHDLASPDKIRALHPGAPWDRYLRLAEQAGLGSGEYELLIV